MFRPETGIVMGGVQQGQREAGLNGPSGVGPRAMEARKDDLHTSYTLVI